jgi:hypothetical protein
VSVKTLKVTGHPTIQQVKFGRKRPKFAGPQFRLRNYLRASLPSPPTSVDYSGPAASILSDIMGNDRLGDCTCAGAYHIAGVETANAGDPFHATLLQVVQDYSAVSGYVPGNESTDNGADEVTCMNYWTNHGFANGTKLSGWLAVDATNLTELMTALWLFENLYFGLECPDTYTNPFPSGNGFTWGPGTPDPEQGHCIVGVGYNSSGVLISTWGMIGTWLWPAVHQLAIPSAGGAAYVWLTPDQIAKAALKAPNGVAWTDLLSDFDSMGGNVPVTPPPPAPAPAPPPAPAPAPTPPVIVPPSPAPPIPVPPAIVTLSQAQAWVEEGIGNRFPTIIPRAMAIQQAKIGLAKFWPTPVSHKEEEEPKSRR